MEPLKKIKPPKNFWSFLRLGKRQKIIIATIVVTFALIVAEANSLFLTNSYLIMALAGVTYLFSIWALWEGMSKIKAVILLILPTMFTISVVSFYFLLPIRWLTRLPEALIFGFSFYSLLLSQNVFNVAATRTIPLYRAASTVSFLFTLITAFFLFAVIFALRLPFYWNGLAIFLISFPLILQVLWSVQMEDIKPQIVIYSLILALLVGEGAIALSFWPVIPVIWSLSLSIIIYVLMGITTEFMREKLTKRTSWEFIGVGFIVILISIFTTTWG